MKLGEIKAPSGGIVSWSTAPRMRVRRGESVGAIALPGGREAKLTAPKDGLLMTRVAEQGRTKKAAIVAAVVFHQAFLQGMAHSGTPTREWSCEVVSEAANQRAPCKITKVTRRSAGYHVTATADPRGSTTLPTRRCD